MDVQGLQFAALALVIGTMSVILAIVVIRIWDRSQGDGGPRASSLGGSLQPMVFLFRGRRLVDATGPARHLLAKIAMPDDEWARLMGWIGPRFPDADDIAGRLARDGQIEITGHVGSGSARLRLSAEEVEGGLIRITLIDPVAEHAGIVVDSMSQQAMEEELDLLRRALDQTPMLVWRQDADGRVIWANAAYLRCAEAQGGGELGWPLPRLFDAVEPPEGTDTASRRASLDIDGTVSWYDCHAHRAEDHVALFALPADAAVRAERSLREFVQTLTKTFADLPIGLAIFDRQRNLQLFNPALIDLTNLPPGFLAGRPTLFDFLDKLRELRMVPEPKDYRHWRQQISDLETAAATGRHIETWSLPGGRTYRVTGRPHPDGAVAFLFEDITSEISLARNYRAELLLGTHVMNGIEDALVVFAPNGKMLLSNDAYTRLWGTEDTTLSETVGHWRRSIGASPGLDALCDALTGDMQQPDGVMSGPGGRILDWRVTRLSAGRSMIRFRAAPSLEPPVQAPREAGLTVAELKGASGS